jgi:hypothetical protein
LDPSEMNRATAATATPPQPMGNNYTAIQRE